MKRSLTGLSCLLAVVWCAVPAVAQEKAAPADDRLWSLTLTVHPDAAKRAADDIARMAKERSAASTNLLGNVLGIFSASVNATTEGEARARASLPQSPMAGMATTACAAAVDNLGKQAAVVRSGYEALAAGLPPDKLAAVQKQLRELGAQLATTTKGALDAAAQTVPVKR